MYFGIAKMSFVISRCYVVSWWFGVVGGLVWLCSLLVLSPAGRVWCLVGRPSLHLFKLNASWCTLALFKIEWCTLALFKIECFLVYFGVV